VAIGVVVYLIRRHRQRRRLAEMQKAQRLQPPQPPPNFIAEPTYQMGTAPWASPYSAHIPSYYAGNSNTANLLPSPSQEPLYATGFSRQPSMMTRSEFSSTHTGSNDHLDMAVSRQPQRNASGSAEASGVGLSRQNTKARYITTAQREEAAWEEKRRRAQTAEMSRVGVSDTAEGTIADMGSWDIGLGRSGAPSSDESGGRWAMADLGPADRLIPPALPPPAYSEHYPNGDPHAM